MANSFEKDLKLVLSFVKNSGQYDVPKITAELGQLQKQLQSFRGLLDNRFSLSINGIKDVVQFKDALISLNKSILPATNGIQKFGQAIKQSLSGIDGKQLTELQETIQALSDALSGFSIKNLSKDFDSLVKVLETLNEIVTSTIAPLSEFENVIGALDVRINASIDGLQKFVTLTELLNTVSGGAASNLNGVRTPVFKGQDQNVTDLVGQYNRLADQIDRAAISVNKFNEAEGVSKLTAGQKKQLANDAKLVTNAYDQLSATAAKLNVTLEILENTEGVNQGTLNSLRNTISDANAQMAQRSQLVQKAGAANAALVTEERKVRDAFNDHITSLGGIIQRQISFIAGATILAGALKFVTEGFKSTYQILSEVQRILVVSRSGFLSTADTAKLLFNTLEDTSARTGTSIHDVATVLKEFGSAGLTTEQSVAALQSTLNNIIATDSSVVETTRLIASTYQILGNTVASSSSQVANFTRINDIFARATNESSLEMDQLVQALKFSLPVGKEAGLNLEELTGVLSQLADEGIRGGNAGRDLRAALQQISQDAPKFAKAFNLNIPLDKPLQFLDILRQFNEQIKNQQLNVDQVGQIFSNLGLRGADVFLLLAQNIDKVDAKIKDLKQNSEGISALGAQTRIESPERQFAILEQNLARLSRGAFKDLIELTIEATKFTNELLSKFKEFPDVLGFDVIIPIRSTTEVLRGLTDVIKSSEEQIASQRNKLNETTIQNNKLITSYEGLITRLNSNEKALAQGNITQEEYANDLNNIAGLSAETAAIFQTYGNNIALVKNALSDLIAENKKYNELIIEEQKNLDKVSFTNTKKDIEDLIPKINEAREKYKSLIEQQKQGINSGNIKAIDPKEIDAAREAFQKLDTDFRTKIINDLQIASRVGGDFGKNVLQFVEDSKAAIGDLTGSGNEIQKLTSLLTITQQELNSFSLDHIVGQVKELKNASIESVRGVQGITSEFIHDFKFPLPDAFVNDFNKQLANIPVQNAANQAGQAFVNAFNFSGLAQTFQKNLSQAGFGNISLDTLKSGLSEIADKTKDSVEQQRLLQDLITSITDKVIKGTEGTASQNKLLEEQQKILTQINALFNSQFSLHDTQIANGQLQLLQDTTRNFLIQGYNKALNDSSFIRRNNIAQDQLEIRNSAASLKDLKDKLTIQQRINALQPSDIKGRERIVEDEKLILSATKTRAQAIEKLFSDQLKINRAYEEAKLTLAQTQNFGNAVADQAQGEINILLQKQKIISENLQLGYLTPIEAQTQLIELQKTELELRNKLLEDQLSLYNESLTVQEKLQEAIFDGSQLEQKRFQFSNQEHDLKEKIAQDELKISEAINKGAGGEDTIRRLNLDIAKNKLQLIDLQRKENIELRDTYEISLRTSELQKSSVEQTSKLAEDAITRLQDPLQKLLSARIAQQPFQEIQRLGTSLGLAQGQINALFDNPQTAIDLFIKGVRDGTVNLTGLDGQVVTLAKDLEVLYTQLKAQREIQNSINSQKFDIYERIFEQGQKIGGPEGFKIATEALQNLNSVTEVLNTTTGKTDLGKTATNLQLINKHLAELQAQDFDNNPLSKMPEVVELATKAIDKLTQSLDRLEEILNKLSFGGNFIGNLQDVFNNSTGSPGLTGSNPRLGGISPFGFAFGGIVGGSGTGDIIPAMLEPGEFVIPKKVVDEKGVSFFQQLIGATGYKNGGRVGFADGGLVGGSDSAQLILINSFLREILNATDKLNADLTKRLLDITSNGTDAYGQANKIISNLQNLSSVTGGGLKEIIKNTDNLDSYLEAIASGTNKEFASRREKDKNDVAEVSASDSLKLAMDVEGLPPGFAFGGYVSGSGTGDVIPAMLEPGEFVIPKEIVDIKGIAFFEDLIGASGENTVGYRKPPNIGRPGSSNVSIGFADGGLVGNAPPSLGGDSPSGNAFNGFTALALASGNVALAAQFVKNSDISKELENYDKFLGTLNKVELTFEKINQQVALFGGRFQHAFDAYRRELQVVATYSDNIFERISARAALRFLEAVTNIDKQMEELFTQTLPNLLTFFLSSVVENNIKILQDYQKQKNQLQQNYVDEKAALIEQLKRNEISYIDFFDKLEDLKTKNNKDQQDLETQKNQALVDSIKQAVGQIATEISQLTTALSKGVSDFIIGLPALLDHAGVIFQGFFGTVGKGFTDIINQVLGVGANNAGGGLGALIGGAIGGISGLAGGPGSAAGGAGVGAGIGDTIGSVVDSVFGVVLGPLKQIGQAILTIGTQFFNLAVQGFSQLLPVITNIALEGQDDFNAFLQQIQSLPDQLKSIFDGLVSRIPVIVNALVAGQKPLLITLGQTFADGLIKIFPQIFDAFGKIVGTALIAVQPIITSIFRLLPQFFTEIFALIATLGPDLFVLIKSLADNFVSFLIHDFPTIANEFLSTLKNAFNSLASVINGPDFVSQIANAFTQVIQTSSTQISQALDGDLGTTLQTFAAGLTQIGQSLIENAPQIINTLTPIISSSFEDAFQSTSPQVRQVFLDAAKFFFDQLLKFIPDFVSFLGNSLLTFIQDFVNNLQSLSNTVDLVGGLIDGLTSGFQAFLDKLTPILESVISTLITKIQNDLPNIITVLENILKSLGGFLANLFTDVFVNIAPSIGEFLLGLFVTLGPQILASIISFLTPDKFISVFETLIDSFISAIEAKASSESGFLGVLGQIFTVVAELSKSFVELLGSIVGLSGVFSGLVAIADVLSNVISAVLTFLGGFVGVISILIAPISQLQTAFIALFSLFAAVNIQIASDLSRILAALVTDIFKQFLQAIDQAQPLLNQLKDSFLKLVTIIGNLLLVIGPVLFTVFHNLVDVFLKLFINSSFLTKGLQAAFTAAGRLGPVFTFLIDHVLLKLDVIVNKLITTLDDLLNNNTDLTDLFNIFNDILAQTLADLEPLVDALMPGLEALLTILAFVIAGPLIAALITLIALLEILIVIIQVFQAIAAALAPVFAILNPLFERLQPILAPLIPILNQVIPVLLAFGFVIFALLGPFGPLIVLLLALSVAVIAVYGAMILLTAAHDRLKPIFIAIGDSLDLLGAQITLFAAVAHDQFIALINGIREALGLNGSNSSGSSSGDNGGGGGGGLFSHLPHFGLGGFVRGAGQKLAIVHGGEYILNPDEVQTLGLRPGSLNTGLTDSGGSSGYSLRPGSLISGLSPTSGVGGSSYFPTIPGNQNSIDYYLQNEYGYDTGISGNQVNGPDSGTSNVGSSSTDLVREAINGQLSVSASNAGQSEAQPSNIHVTIDLSHSNFTSEDAADHVEKKLVEKLNNDNGPLAEVLRNQYKKK